MRYKRLEPQSHVFNKRSKSHWGRWASWVTVLIVLMLILSACGRQPPEGGPETPDIDPSGGTGATAAPDQKPPETEPTPTEVAGGVDPGVWDLGGAVLDDVISISEGDTSGPILTVRVTNPTSETIEVTIPCGLIFQPDDGEEQRLMVIQAVSITLAAGETGELSPYVVCIDGDRSIPGNGSAYVVGTWASGDLLALAQCICMEALITDFDADPMGYMEALSVQFSVWSVASQFSLDEIRSELEEAQGAMGDMMGSEMMEGLEEMFGGLSEFFGVMGGDWLEKCGIEVETE